MFVFISYPREFEAVTLVLDAERKSRKASLSRFNFNPRQRVCLRAPKMSNPGSGKRLRPYQ